MERKRLSVWQLLLVPVLLAGILVCIGLRHGWQSAGEVTGIGTLAAAAIAGWRALGRW